MNGSQGARFFTKTHTRFGMYWLPGRSGMKRQLIEKQWRGLSLRLLSTKAREPDTDIARRLSSALPQLDISTNPYDLENHGRGESYHPTAPPSAVVTPSNIEEVVRVVQFCSEHRIPIVPFGVGTSVEGHVCALQGGISMDMTKFDSIEMVDMSSPSVPDPIVKVGAGVTRVRLNQELRHTGMQFMVDPGADATIGGMVACGASGTTAVRYGTMRDNILGLECVLDDGAIARCGTRALKSSAGYDLTSLITGSEGTLGIITSVTVKLHPIPEHVMAAVCSFDDLHAAAEAVATLKLSGIPIARCELLDETSVAAFNAYTKSYQGDDGATRPAKMDEKPTIFFEFHGPSATSVQEQVTLTESLCTEGFGAFNFRFTCGESERKALWSARHNLYYASLALRPGATTRNCILTDACVPLSKFADLISATVRDVRELGVIGPCFGHAGDGNFHCILPLLDSDTNDYVSRVNQVNDSLIHRTLEAGGTCTGEHGVGYGKIKHLEPQYGEGCVSMMRRIKEAMDPHGIFNPGKVVLPYHS